MQVKPFDRQGNYTQIDNAVIDVIMPTLSPTEWMVLSLIIRKTVGWHKDIDGIAYSQFIKGTGIKSNTTIQRALSKLNKMGIIEVLESPHKSDPHHYRLNRNYSCRVTETVTQPITLNVIRPVTENVDTKEIYKRNIKDTFKHKPNGSIPDEYKDIIKR
jgi:phage replication O-like protein O